MKMEVDILKRSRKNIMPNYNAEYHIYEAVHKNGGMVHRFYHSGNLKQATKYWNYLHKNFIVRDTGFSHDIRTIMQLYQCSTND